MKFILRIDEVGYGTKGINYDYGIRILGYDDREIFINPRYFPNMHCYKLMLKAHYGRYCVRDIRKRARMNLCAWYIHRKSLNKFEGHS